MFAGSMAILWSVVFIPLNMFKISVYCVINSTKINLIQNRTSCSSIRDCDGLPFGILLGKWYCGYMTYSASTYDRNNKKLYIITQRSTFDRISVTESEKNIPKSESTTIWYRIGNYAWLDYTKRSIRSITFQPKQAQKICVDGIVDFYHENDRCVAFINGPPGSGKTTISLLLAKEMSGKLCTTFNPTDPGDSMEKIYGKIEPTKDDPLIILLDEFDIILKKICNGTTKMHKKSPICVHDKISWNKFLDDVDIGMYPFIILLLTSNMCRNNIEDVYDPSFIREGRINKYFEIM